VALLFQYCGCPVPFGRTAMKPSASAACGIFAYALMKSAFSVKPWNTRTSGVSFEPS
jgi:hypothetical protein